MKVAIKNIKVDTIGIHVKCHLKRNIHIKLLLGNTFTLEVHRTHHKNWGPCV